MDVVLHFFYTFWYNFKSNEVGFLSFTTNEFMGANYFY